MKATNRLDRSFGPVGSVAGVIIFIAGMILVYFHFSSVILLLIGAFVGFTSSGTMIDYDHRQIKFSNNIFGFIHTGKWLLIEPTMKLGIKESKQAFTAFSQGNRALDVSRDDFRIFLCDSENKEIMEIKKCKSIDAARSECQAMADSLGLRQV